MKDPIYVQIVTASGGTAFQGILPAEKVVPLIRQLQAIKDEMAQESRSGPKRRGVDDAG